MLQTDRRLRRHFRRIHIRALLLCTALIAAVSCTTVETQSFRKVKTENIDSAQVAPGADFSQYDRLLADNMGIYFPEKNPVPEADLQRIRQIFRAAFIAELGDYQIVSQPGPTTMGVQASLIDLRGSSGAEIPQLRRDVREIATANSLVFLMEMRDSQTGRVLARATDGAAAPSISTSGGNTTDWSAVDAAAARWARLFREFLDQNLGK